MARTRKRNETELSRFVDAALKQVGLTHTEFSRRVGLSPSRVSDLKLKQDVNAPDEDFARRWSEVLGLDGASERQLYELLQLAHAPAYVQGLVERMRNEGHLPRVAEPRTDYHTDLPPNK